MITMSNRPKIRITLIDRKGPCGCHRGHKVGDSFDFDTERGQLSTLRRQYSQSAGGHGCILLSRRRYNQRI